jgi:uncharacterized protein YkwD
MRSIRPVSVAVIAVLSASFCVVAPATVATAAVSTSTVDSKCWDPRPAEQGFAGQLNTARLNNGLNRVQLDPELSKAARVHTWAMAKRDALYHTPSHRLTRRVTNWVILGENVGVGGTVDTLHDAFMGSPAHRANIMRSSFRHVGIGSLTRHGRLWVTVIFEGTTDPGTTLRMPRC